MPKIPPFLLLDAWRGLAAFWVVMYHSSMAFLEENPQYVPAPYYAISHVGKLGITLFFIISGYCITGAAYQALRLNQGTTGYARDRFRRIYPPYFATCLLALGVLLSVLFAQHHHILPPANYYPPPHPESPLFWLATLFLVQVELYQFCLVMVFWTLCYEIIFYTIIGLFLFVSSLVSHRLASLETTFTLFFGGTVLTTYLSLAWLIISPATCPFPLDKWYQFGWGALLFQLVAAQARPETERTKAVMRARQQIFIAGILTLLFAYFHSINGWPGHPSSRVEAMACLVVVGILWLVFPHERRLAQSRLIRPVMWLGTISYSLYLTHTIPLPFVTTGLRHLGLDRDWYWVTFLIQIAISIFGGWIFYLTVERRFISSRQKQRVATELALSAN